MTFNFSQYRFAGSVMLVLVLVSPSQRAQAHGNEHAGVKLNAAEQDVRNSDVHAADVVRETPEPDINPSVGGRWSDVYDWPLVAVHAALLPNGKVLAWDATPDDSDDDPHTTDNYTTRVTLWNPIDNTHVPTNNDTDTDLFCAGSAHLWDGRILFAGGDGGRAGANGPLANSNIYNPVSNTWHRTENMNAPRWYSSVAALSNGEMLTLGGTYEPSPLGEVFQFDQTWRPLSGSFEHTLTGDYQWLQQTPEGKVLSFGPSNVLVDIDTNGSGTYSTKTLRDSIEDRDYGSYAMYAPGKILVAGGAQGLDSAVIIDTATHQTTDTNSLNHGRRQHNLTILADGSVLATGGNDDGAVFYSPTAWVMETELWNPDTQTWTVLNPMPTTRQYHSIALLLPDGQVLSAGGGICGDCYELGYEERNAEIFSPPYLFDSDGTLAARPVLTAVPGEANYGETFSVSLDHSKPIQKVHLIKIGSVTHSENQDQRLVPVAYDTESTSLTLTMPDSRNTAPPGHYLLFVVDSDGVPSVGKMLKLGQPLIDADQLVRTTLEQNNWDTYLTQASSGRFKVELNAPVATSLFVSATAPVLQAQQSGVLCSALVRDTAAAVCELDVSIGTQLYISVNGPIRADYSLVYRDSVAESSSGPTPPVTTPDTPDAETVTAPNSGADQSEDVPAPNTVTGRAPQAVSSGGGSVTFQLLLVLLILASGRSFSGRWKRV